MIDDKWVVVAGCLTEYNLTLVQYRNRALNYGDPTKTAETIRIIDYLEACIAAHP